MSNFLEELKKWYLQNTDEHRTNYYGLYYVDGETKLSYYQVEEICNEVFGWREEHERLIEDLCEQADFIRLLRKENAELRGKEDER